jgi:two-component system response regulator ResD
MAKKQKKKILVVDDTVSIRTIAQRMLERAGYDVVTAADAFEAEKILEKNPIDLIVLDVTMPEKDGYEFCEELRDSDNFADVPVLFLTAKEEHLHRVAAFSAGGSDFLTKPFMNELLIEKVKTLLGDAR